MVSSFQISTVTGRCVSFSLLIKEENMIQYNKEMYTWSALILLIGIFMLWFSIYHTGTQTVIEICFLQFSSMGHKFLSCHNYCMTLSIVISKVHSHKHQWPFYFYRGEYICVVKTYQDLVHHCRKEGLKNCFTNGHKQ